jgi:non-ribosomal peptide synthase protein (TIGR01720 family)
MLSNVPDKGLGYGVLIGYHNAPLPKINFNYLGQFNSSDDSRNNWEIDIKNVGNTVHSDNHDKYLLNINCLIINHYMEFYVASKFTKEISNKFAQSLLNNLERLIEHCMVGGEDSNSILEFKDTSLTAEETKLYFKDLTTRVKKVYELSPIQEGLLFHHLYKPGSTEYIGQRVFKFSKVVDEKILRRVFEIIISRYDVLRTGFKWSGTNRVQYVLDEIELPLEELVWDTDHELELEKFLLEDRNKTFNLEEAPLFRLKFVKSPEAFYVIWTNHHILLDGWSQQIIIGEMYELYNQLYNKSIPQLKNRKQYSSYISWQKEQDKEETLNYWRSYLQGLDEPTILSDNLIGDQQEGYNHYSFSLDKAISNQIRVFAKENGLTLSTVIQGIFGIVLGKYLYKQDFVYGVTISGRSVELENIEDIVGIFINTLPLRIRLDPSYSLKDYFESIQKDIASMNSYSYSSLAEIQKLVINQGGSLFNAQFVFENYPVTNNSMNRLKPIKELSFDKSEYPFTIAVIPQEQLLFVISYNKTKFSDKFIEQFKHNLQQIISEVIGL